MKVSELIEILKQFPAEMDVEMSMNMEYQSPVEVDMVVVEEYNGRKYVCINDSPSIA